MPDAPDTPDAPASPVLDFPTADVALEQLRGVLAAMPRAEVRRFTANVPTAVRNALVLYRSFIEDRPLFEATFRPEAFSCAELEDLGIRARALWYTDVLLRQAVDPQSLLPELIARGNPLRKKMLRAGRYLWEFDPDLGPVIAEIISGRGRADMADDLMALSSLFTENWVQASGRCEVTEADPQEARSMALRILDALGMTAGSTKVVERRNLRNRAGTYLRNAADKLRDAAKFVHRRDPDALARYPSLFKRTSRPSPRAPKPPTPVEPTPEG